MNFLAHAYLARQASDACLAGNMIADFVKGQLALQQLPPALAAGITMHRQIDDFTDNHPAVKRASLYFREGYGRYAPAIIDVLFDHFLANDPALFAYNSALLDFSQHIYDRLNTQQSYFPPSFIPLFNAMKAENWLYKYRTVKYMETSLNGLARRAAYMPPIAAAYPIFVSHYYILQQCYQELINDVLKYVHNLPNM